MNICVRKLPELDSGNFSKERPMEKKQYLEAGKIINTHGVRGELKVVPHTL